MEAIAITSAVTPAAPLGSLQLNTSTQAGTGLAPAAAQMELVDCSAIH
jgi:hypothetical protein